MGAFDKYSVLALFLILSNIKRLCLTMEPELEYLCNPDEQKQQRIVGGTHADIKFYQFMAAIVVRKSRIVLQETLQCGCSIIATQWALTAAHCVELLEAQNFTVSDMFISSGSQEWRKGNKHDVLNMISHENYDSMSLNNDVALIIVKNPFNGPNEVAVALASKNYPYKPNTQVTALGWGLHKDSGTSVQSSLEEVDVIIFNQTYCRDLYAEQLEELVDSQICAGSAEGGKDACQFDSGGPLVDKNILIGIISWGIGCGRKESPGVYTKVSLLEDWLTSTSRKSNAPIHTQCSKKEDEETQKSDGGYLTRTTELIMLLILPILLF